jgi:hypothetical protein
MAWTDYEAPIGIKRRGLKRLPTANLDGWQEDSALREPTDSGSATGIL